MKISAVIITYNEAHNIGRCLDSLQGVADDVVVVDSFSSDPTVAICLQKQVRVVQHPFENFIQQKNFALQQAQYDLVLSLDADEALSPTLHQSIMHLKKKPPRRGVAWKMNRLTNFCGQWIRHGGWYPDAKIRLFDRRQAQWGGSLPHERLIFLPPATVRVEKLSGDLLHYSYYTEHEHIWRAKKYAAMAASYKFQQGRQVYFWHLTISPMVKFLKNYVFRLGFLDGRAGWRICYVSAWETYWKYKLLQEKWLKMKGAPSAEKNAQRNG